MVSLPQLRLLATDAARAWLQKSALPFREEPLPLLPLPDSPPPEARSIPYPPGRFIVTAPLRRTPQLDQQLYAAGCDWGWIAPHHRLDAIRLFVSDMDSTLIPIECIDEVAALIDKHTEVAAITEAAMAGKLDFAAAFTQRVALLAGFPATLLDHLAAHRITYNPGVRTLTAFLKAQGAYLLLVSGGFPPFTTRVAAELGFDQAVANALEIAPDGCLTGNTLGPIVDGMCKKRALLAAQTARNLPAAAILAAGDGANDGPMLAAAGIAIAYRPKPVLLPALTVISTTWGLDLALFLLPPSTSAGDTPTP
ncbi:MAG: phosphoserine phosphatase SerB [Hydrogenophilus sp.]|nr:phosphoserine phosphatase SerB [Hydrogenophilus sp.]